MARADRADLIGRLAQHVDHAMHRDVIAMSSLSASFANRVLIEQSWVEDPPPWGHADGTRMLLADWHHAEPVPVTAYRDEVERERRTLMVSGPSDASGSRVPAVGGRLSLDVGAPRLDVFGEVAGGPVVSGQALQVGCAISDARHGITVYADIRGTAQAETPIMIRVLQDRQP